MDLREARKMAAMRRRGEAKKTHYETEPNPVTTEMNETDYEAYLKTELMDMLDNRGIEYNKKQTKAELISLLKG